MTPLLRGALGTLLAMCVLALPVLALMQGWVGDERMPVRWLEIHGEFNRVSAEQLRANISSQIEGGFFSVSLQSVRDAAEAQPWVAHVEARKVWPDTLELRVLEHEPVAHWNDVQLLTRQGRLIDAPGPGMIAGLPRLRGSDERREEVMELFGEFQGMLAGTGLALDGLTLSELGTWFMVLSNGGLIIAGREQPVSRLRRFLRVYPEMMPGSDIGFARVDLRYSNGFALSWRIAEPERRPVREDSEAES